MSDRLPRWTALNRLVNDFCAQPSQVPAQVRQARAIRRHVGGFHRWHRTALHQPRRRALPGTRHLTRNT
jgi:hypothetical protein